MFLLIKIVYSFITLDIFIENVFCVKKLIITEQDKNHIRGLYGLLNEETEPDLKKNHDPNKQPSLINKRPNCDPFCQFDAEEVQVIQKCFTASQFIGYTQMDKNQTKEDKEEIISLTLGACSSTGKITQENAKYLSTKFKNIFFNSWSSSVEPKKLDPKTFECEKRKKELNSHTPLFSEIDRIFLSATTNTCDTEIKNLLIKKLEFLKQESLLYLKESSEFYLNYFDYNKKPEILDKIRTIHMKNEKVRPIHPKESESDFKERQLNPSAPSERDIKIIIDNLKKDCLDKITVKLEFDYCLKKRGVFAFVREFEPYSLNVCPFRFLKFDSENGGYLYKKNAEDLKKTILHEYGHMVDFYFKSKEINLYISKSEESNDTNVSSVYPHPNSHDNIFKLIDVLSDKDTKEYTEEPDEQFARYKVLYDYLISQNYDIRRFNDKQYFQNFFGKLFENSNIVFKSDGDIVEDYVYQNGILKFNSEEIGTVSTTSWDGVDEISFLFDNIGTYTTEKKGEGVSFKVKFDINKLFDDMNYNYVELRTNKKVGSDVA